MLLSASYGTIDLMHSRRVFADPPKAGARAGFLDFQPAMAARTSAGTNGQSGGTTAATDSDGLTSI
jgi:hypothetical protein